MSATYLRHDGTEIEIGDGIVAGEGADRDAGQVVEIHGSLITVGWQSGARTTVDAAVRPYADVYRTFHAAASALDVADDDPDAQGTIDAGDEIAMAICGVG